MRIFKALLIASALPTLVWGFGPSWLRALAADPPAATEPVEKDAKPTARNPVALTLSVKPANAKRGDVVLLTAKVRIAEKWHIYAVDKPVGIARPTKLKLTLPAGVQAAGDWKIPAPKKDAAQDEETFIYEDAVSFTRKLEIGDAAAAGKQDVALELSYMSCNDVSCLPPAKKTVKVALEVAR